MDAFLYIIAGPLLLISVAASVYVRIRLRPGPENDLDDYYYEFEEIHPDYAKYLKWSRITFGAIVVSVLLLFIAYIV